MRHCHDWETAKLDEWDEWDEPDLDEDDAVSVMTAHRFLTHQTDRNPRILPYVSDYYSQRTHLPIEVW